MTVTATAFKRSAYVVAAVLERAAGRCERCKQLAPFAKRADGEPYLEVHHKIPLVDDGDDTVENAIALCPNCHRWMHFGPEDGMDDALSYASVDGIMLDGLGFCARVYGMFNALCARPDFQTRLRKRPTKFEKRLLEELVPLARYVQLTHTRGVNVSLCWSSGRQAGEAVVRRSGLSVEHGGYQREGMLEVTQAAHKNDHLLRELLDTQGHAFSPDGIRVQGKRSDGSRTVTSDAHSYGGDEAIVRQGAIVLHAVQAKIEKPYPDHTTLIVQVTLNSLYLPDEWDDLVQRVRDHLPEHSFEEIWLFDSSDRYYARIPALR